MAQRIYIQLARTGDILNVLPLAYADAMAGDRSAIMLCKDFAGILDGCAYVDPIIFEGTPWELDRAVVAAEKMSDRVLNVQLAGPYEVVKNVVATRNGKEYRTTTESFLKDQWMLAGRLPDWKKQLPLIFDRRSPAREKALVDKYVSKKGKYTIWVATSGVSSPFPYTPLLNELIKLKFGRYYNVVDISDVRAERIYDLLGLFENSLTHCLVATDSAPLHLAYACPKLPVVALTNDRPSLWHGSCWRPNHISHVRYSHFPNDAVLMLKDIENLGNSGSPFNPDLKTRKIIHVWSEYEGPHNVEPWKMTYATNHWVATPVRYGTVGRDCKTQLKDNKCFPFVKDVIRIATLRANTDDIICLSRADTAPITSRLTDIILRAETPLYFRRSRGGMHHPAVDMFCFTKVWWQQHQNDLPDFVLGKDSYWHRAFSEFIKLHGGQEVEFAIEKTA